MNPPVTPPNPPAQSVSRRGLLALVAVVVAIYAIGIGGAVIVDRCKTPEYEATAKFKILRPRISISATMDTADNAPGLRDSDDFTSEVYAMQSTEILRRITARLSPVELEEVVAPYRDGNIFSGPLNPVQVIGLCYRVTPDRPHYVIFVRYRHPNRALAVKMANYFVDEIKRANNVETTLIEDPMVEKLAIQLDQIERDIAELKAKRDAFSPLSSEYESLSKEIKIKEENYAVCAATYKRKKADLVFDVSPVRLIEPATASDEPVNRNLGLAVAVGAAGATVVNIGVVAMAGMMFMVRRMRNRAAVVK